MAKKKKDRKRARVTAQIGDSGSSVTSNRAKAERGRGYWRYDYLAAAVAVILFAGHLFLTGDYFSGSGTDSVSEEHPTHFFAAYWLKRGVLPLWNPFIFGGVPFQTGVYDYLYPGYWTCFLLPPQLDIKVVILVHLLIAAAGGVFLARGRVKSPPASLIAGLVYGLSAFNAIHLFAGHRQMIATAAYLPWVAGCLDRILRGERRCILPGVALTGLMMLAGHFHIIYIGVGGLLLFALLQTASSDSRSPLSDGGGWTSAVASKLKALRAPVGYWLVLFTGGALIAAVQILPIISTIGSSQRAGGGGSFTSSFSSSPANLLTFLLPDLFGNRIDAAFVGDWGYWEALGYLGLVPLSLIALSGTVLPWCRLLPFALVMTGALIVALGSHTPFFDLYLAAIPGASLLRSPGRFTLLVTLFGALLSAEALDGWLAGLPVEKRRWQVRICLFAPPLLALIALALLGTADAESFRRWLSTVGDERRLSGQSVEQIWALLALARANAVKALLVLGLAALALWMGHRRPDRAQLAAALLALLCAADLLHWGHRFLRTDRPDKFHLPAQTVEALKKDRDPALRVIPPAEDRWYNFPAMVALGSPGGYANFMDGRWARYINRSQGRSLDRFFALERFHRYSPLIHHLGVEYLLTRNPLRGGGNRSISGYRSYSFQQSAGGLNLYRDEGAAPRAALVHRLEIVAQEEQAYQRMESADFDIRSSVILEREPPASFPPPEPNLSGQTESAAITLYQPNRVQIEVEAASRAVLVLSDVLHTGWQARVDGREVPMLHANRVMRALPVPAGKHTVVMTYMPLAFATGAAVSLISVTTLLFLFLALRRKLKAAA